jgi:hypothetical protein
VSTFDRTCPIHRKATTGKFHSLRENRHWWAQRESHVWDGSLEDVRGFEVQTVKILLLELVERGTIARLGIDEIA